VWGNVGLSPGPGQVERNKKKEGKEARRNGIGGKTKGKNRCGEGVASDNPGHESGKNRAGEKKPPQGGERANSKKGYHQATNRKHHWSGLWEEGGKVGGTFAFRVSLQTNRRGGGEYRERKKQRKGTFLQTPRP